MAYEASSLTTFDHLWPTQYMHVNGGLSFIRMGVRRSGSFHMVGGPLPFSLSLFCYIGAASWTWHRPLHGHSSSSVYETRISNSRNRRFCRRY